MITAGGFAVLDVETTGFAAGRDRVIEVAVVHTDQAGVVTGQWCTLVNPRRDLGAQHVHRITAHEVRRAPRFEEIAGDLVALLRGRVLVAHNLSFDARFLAAELALAGVLVPADLVDGVCTMNLASRFLATPRRNLAACCAAAGIELVDAHSALADATATAGLLAHYLATGEFGQHALLAAARTRSWPNVPELGTPAVGRGARGAAARRRRTAPPPPGFRLVPGDRIAFTGATERGREEWQARAVRAGLVTHPENVCRWTKAVVVADPDSMSTKARKARDYRIPLIDERAFARLLDELGTRQPR
ncbi:DNA polymerase-3 subunit epsilon [Crossiella equi]|uniref:DNA polymerase-3 subunit epsilon n=1 Tax=Crossiella equi TaxID=130796 RepID=A0ABS5A4R0_9PSEU|nr:exonuclease domain-containing protein [Crossiella equi]MBP2471538.1 DNA polymerase-3 subunit epsilon [Crossiella equi]